MGRARKFDYQAAIQDNLIAASGGLTLDELLERSGLAVDRSTLFRHLTSLIQQGRVERVGKARSSRYLPRCGAAAGEIQSSSALLRPAVRTAAEIQKPSLPGTPSLPATGTEQPLDQANRDDPPVTDPGSVAAEGGAQLEHTAELPRPADLAPAEQKSPKSDGSPAENDGQSPVQAEVVPALAPDYSVAIRKAVRVVVREWKRCDRRNLQIYLSLLAEPEHVDALSATVEQELAGLHEGNLEKFGLTPDEMSEFDPRPRSTAADD